MASPFKLPSQCKTCSPAPFYQANLGQDGNQGSTLALRPLCSVLAQTVLHVTITSETALVPLGDLKTKKLQANTSPLPVSFKTSQFPQVNPSAIHQF